MNFKDTKLFKEYFANNKDKLETIYLFNTNINHNLLFAYDNSYKPENIISFKLSIDKKQSEVNLILNIYKEVDSIQDVLENKNLDNVSILSTKIIKYKNDHNPIQDIVDLIIYINKKHKFNKENIDANLNALSEINWLF